MRVGVMMAGLLKKLLHTKQNVDSLSEEEIVNGEDTTVAEKGREESQRRSKRGRSKVSKSTRDESQSTSKVRRQSSKSKLSSKNGERSRAGIQGRKADSTSSQSKSMGSIKQSRRTKKSGGNK